MPLPIEARPKTEKELAMQAERPDVVQAASERGVTEIVHFTTVQGAVGVFAAGAVKSRKRLPKEQYLEHVYRPNARIRKDQAWLDYINLSIQRINDWMFDTSKRWHADKANSWIVLCFDVGILAHPGVVFATTNNIYPACRRAEGIEGFSRLYAPVVFGRYDEEHTRQDKDTSWPTDRQAEVLYPGELSCDHLRRVDVQCAETDDTIHGTLRGLGLTVPVRHAPEVFR